MIRPDPHAVPRRPPAAAQRSVAYRPRRGAERFGLLTDSGRLDVDALHQVLESAERVVEAGIYVEDGAEVLVGSVSFELLGGGAPALRDVLAHDPRVARVVLSHVHRAAAHLLGPDTPEAIRVEHSLRVMGDSLRIHADFEGRLGSRAAEAG